MLCGKCKTNPKHKTHAWCQVCRRAYDSVYHKRNAAKKVAQVAARRQRNREFLADYLRDKECLVCGEKDSVVLEFDHRENKRKAISELSGASYSIETIRTEIEKCDVLCANCHRRRTAEQFGWHK